MMAPDYEALMDEARLTNAFRDETDRRNGFATPTSGRDLVTTVMLALKAGIVTGDWTCVAEAQAMLEELVGVLGEP
jgi:hypothetical protein